MCQQLNLHHSVILSQQLHGLQVADTVASHVGIKLLSLAISRWKIMQMYITVTRNLDIFVGNKTEMFAAERSLFERT